MNLPVKKLAILGQGLIGSSITRAVYERNICSDVTITDHDPKVRKRLLELGLGQAKVVNGNVEAAREADLVIACVPVGQMAALAGEIGPHLKQNAIFSDVGSVKTSVIADTRPHLPDNVHLIAAHPLAGTEKSGPESGLPKLFVNRWCIVTPEDNYNAAALDAVRRFWERLGSQVEVMTARQHDYVVAITSHLPHLVAFSIFQTALRQEEKSDAEVIKFSAGGFKDFTRIASSNPTMWRDIFLKNKGPVLDTLRQFVDDLEACAAAIESDDAEMLLKLFSSSRITRRKVIEREHISLLPDTPEVEVKDTLYKPYSSGD